MSASITIGENLKLQYVSVLDYDDLDIGGSIAMDNNTINKS